MKKRPLAVKKKETAPKAGDSFSRVGVKMPPPVVPRAPRLKSASVSGVRG